MRFTLLFITTLLIALAITPAGAETRGWTKYCGKDDKANDVCFTVQDGRTETAQPAAVAALIEPAEATPDLVGKLKSAQTLQIQYVRLDGISVTFALPLNDLMGNSFRKAYEGPR
jgi:invasion protein IalB